MKISDSLKESCIDLDVQPEEKISLIKNMIEKIGIENQLNEETKNGIAEEVILREKMMSTGMQNGVALPHCSTSLTDTLYTFVGICKKGTDFNSADAGLSHIIVLLIIPKSKMSAHIKTLALIAKLLNNENVRQQLIKANKPDDVMKIFIDNE